MNGYQTMSTLSERRSFLKVLIVDDDAALRRLVVKLIRDTWPLKILEAEDGLEALNLLHASAWRIVTLHKNWDRVDKAEVAWLGFEVIGPTSCRVCPQTR